MATGYLRQHTREANRAKSPDWPPIPCEVCRKDIPMYDKDGELIPKWKYHQRKTCGRACYGRLHTKNRKDRTPLPELSMMDKFISGYPYD